MVWQWTLLCSFHQYPEVSWQQLWLLIFLFFWQQAGVLSFWNRVGSRHVAIPDLLLFSEAPIQALHCMDRQISICVAPTLHCHISYCVDASSMGGDFGLTIQYSVSRDDSLGVVLLLLAQILWGNEHVCMWVVICSDRPLNYTWYLISFIINALTDSPFGLPLRSAVKRTRGQPGLHQQCALMMCWHISQKLCLRQVAWWRSWFIGCWWIVMPVVGIMHAVKFQ